MKELEETRTGSEHDAANQLTQSGELDKTSTGEVSRRNFLGISSTALATAAFAGLTAHAQEAQNTRKAEKDSSVSVFLSRITYGKGLFGK